jgi:argininosuccinate lyase
MVDSAYTVLDQSPLGAGAGYGVPVKLDRELTADLLGFGGVQKNSIYVMNSRGKFEFNLLSALGGIQLDLSRLAEDLITFSDAEFDFFDIPEPFTTGSSIMPQKENPDVLELIRGRAGAFSGQISNLFSLLHGLRSGYSRDLQETKKALVEGLDNSESSLAVLPPLINGLKINKQALISNFTEEVFATDEVFDLVKDGKPFRDAYRTIKERFIAREETQAAGEDRARKAIKARRHLGGPGNLQLDSTKGELDEEREKWKTREEKFHKALSKLEKFEDPRSGGD